MVLTKNQKKDLVIRHHENGMTYRDIMKAVRISPRDIGNILKKHYNEPEPVRLSNRTRAIGMFAEGKNTIEVLTALDLGYDEVRRYYGEYLTLKNLTDFINFYREHQRILPFLLEIIEKMKRYGLLEENVYTLINELNERKDFRITKNYLQHEVNCLMLKKKVLEDESPNGKIPRLI